MTNTVKKLYLIDGSSYIYRAFHAIRDLRTSKGFPTNAIYGFVGMILKIIREVKPDYFAIVFDSRGPTFRDELFREYKANRPEMPDELVPQIPKIHQVVEAFRIPAISREGYEADDLIATLVKKLDQPGLEFVVVTGDKDMMQLVSDRVRLYDPMKEKFSGPEEVREKFGVGPEKVVEILGLAGDAIDNIPGVPGIGDKTAKDLIQAFGSIEGVLENLDRIPGEKKKQNLREHAETARLSKKLATLADDVPLEISLPALAPAEPDRARLSELFRELEFSRFARELAPEKTISYQEYKTVLAEEELDRIIRELAQAPRFSVDLETVNPATPVVTPVGAEIVGISLSWKEHEAYYLPVAHRYLGAPRQLARDLVLEKLKPILENPAVEKVGQNIKYDYEVFKNYGITLAGIGFDPMVASYLLNPGKAIHGLAELALEYLGHTIISYKEVTGTGKKSPPRSFDEVEVERAAVYSGEDADLALILSGLLEKKLREEGLDGLFRELELPLIPVLAEMEWAGVKLDLELLKKLSAEFAAELKIREEEIHRLAGEVFNINSPKQLAEILFEKLKLPAKKKTKTGYSTDVEVLSELSLVHPLPKNLVEYRNFFKLKSTYVDALPTLVNRRTGRVHASFNQAVTATGRLSSSDPNLQNIPIRTPEGRKIRRAFIAEAGHLLLSADYSQIELRILAHLSGDPLLIESFEKGEDVHKRTAALIFGNAAESLDELRRRAKVINFGIVYGMSAYGLARELGVEVRLAQAIIDDYFQRYRGVKTYLDETLAAAREKGAVSTLWGRRRPLPELKSPDKNTRNFAERMAINTPIQGSAADLIKAAMIRISKSLPEKGAQARMIIQVHDELVFEVPEKELDAVRELVREEMEGVIKLRVPLKVDINSGPNWAEAH
ncbi:MAG: DNA polymerase I [Proteobacteria bacterium]|nr:DNA polymerase I [Pseudomonadota bacterium]